MVAALVARPVDAGYLVVDVMPIDVDVPVSILDTDDKTPLVKLESHDQLIVATCIAIGVATGVETGVVLGVVIGVALGVATGVALGVATGVETGVID